MNRVCLSGRLTATPEFKMTKNHNAVTTFTIAVKRPRQHTLTDFITCVAWCSTAEFICRNFIKGKWIEVEGALIPRSWEDGKGKKHTVYEVECSDAFFGGEKEREPLNMNENSGADKTPPEEEFAEFFNDVEFLE